MNIGYLLSLVGWILEILIWVIIVDALLTWFPQVNRHHPIVVALRQITEPIYRPIRRVVPPQRTGGLDISPLIAVIGLQFVRFALGQG